MIFGRFIVQTFDNPEPLQGVAADWWSDPSRDGLVRHSFSVQRRSRRKRGAGRGLSVEVLNRDHVAFPFVGSVTSALVAANAPDGEYGGVVVRATGEEP